MVTPAGNTKQPPSLRQTELNGRVQAELRAEMARQGLTNVALGALTGDSSKVIARATGSNYEGATPARVTLDELDRICRALRVPVGEMIARAQRISSPQRRAS